MKKLLSALLLSISLFLPTSVNAATPIGTCDTNCTYSESPYVADYYLNLMYPAIKNMFLQICENSLSEISPEELKENVNTIMSMNANYSQDMFNLMLGVQFNLSNNLYVTLLDDFQTPVFKNIGQLTSEHENFDDVFYDENNEEIKNLIYFFADLNDDVKNSTCGDLNNQICIATFLEKRWSD